MDYTFREMDWKRDRRQVLEFQRDTYELNFPGFRVTRSFLWDYELQLRDSYHRDDHALFVLECEQGLAGFLWLSIIVTMTDPRVGFINNLYVAPAHRSRGLGKLLVEKADEWFRSQGVPKAQLTASTVNDVAIRLYESMGYETIRVRMEKAYQ
ncbi:MAG: GNAT family N-acetyltransferase [Armatimonadota bacterium]